MSSLRKAIQSIALNPKGDAKHRALLPFRFQHFVIVTSFFRPRFRRRSDAWRFFVKNEKVRLRLRFTQNDTGEGAVQSAKLSTSEVSSYGSPCVRGASNEFDEGLSTKGLFL